MRAVWQSVGSGASTILRVLVLFAIVRLAFGVLAIMFLSDEGLAYSLRATAILGTAAIVCIAVTLVVRRIRTEPVRD